jgi:hypothetical protein
LCHRHRRCQSVVGVDEVEIFPRGYAEDLPVERGVVADRPPIAAAFRYRQDRTRDAILFEHSELLLKERPGARHEL